MNATLPYIHVETTRHGKRNTYFRKGQGSRVRMPDDQTSDDFKALYAKLVAGRGATTVRGIGIMRQNYINDALASKIKAALTRDRKMGRKADIDIEWAKAQIAAQNNACALTGIPFQYQGLRKGRLSPFAPSLDRIDNSKGYEKSNVKIVVSAINMMRLDWGDDVFDAVAQAYVQRKLSRTQNPVRESCGKSPIKSTA